MVVLEGCHYDSFLPNKDAGRGDLQVDYRSVLVMKVVIGVVDRKTELLLCCLSSHSDLLSVVKKKSLR